MPGVGYIPQPDSSNTCCDCPERESPCDDCEDGGCDGKTVEVDLAFSATITCLGGAFTILLASGSKSHTFQTSDPDPDNFFECDQCMSFNCVECAPGLESFGIVCYTMQRLCGPPLSLTVNVDVGCTECLEPPCDPNHDPVYETDYSVTDSINTLDDYPGGLPDGETIIMDHFEDDVTIFGAPCHREIDITLTVTVT